MSMSREFLEKITEQCEPLFQFNEANVKMYWENKPSKEDAIEYFSRRMINERTNAIQFSRRVSQMPMDTTPEEMFLLSKQAHDEAKHFWFVKDIVESMTGEPVDVSATFDIIKEKQLRSASEGRNFPVPSELLAQFECANDPIAIALYQFIAEGLAHRNWSMQATVAPTKMIAEKYAEIAKDEKFHAQIGRMQLEKLIVNEESLAHATKLSQEIIEILWVFARAEEDRCIKVHIPVYALD